MLAFSIAMPIKPVFGLANSSLLLSRKKDVQRIGLFEAIFVKSLKIDLFSDYSETW